MGNRLKSENSWRERGREWTEKISIVKLTRNIKFTVTFSWRGLKLIKTFDKGKKEKPREMRFPAGTCPDGRRGRRRSKPSRKESLQPLLTLPFSTWKVFMAFRYELVGPLWFFVASEEMGCRRSGDRFL